MTWLLAELGLPYQWEDIGGGLGKVHVPELKAINPNGQVPTLVEDDFVLWESNAILRYLAAAHAPRSTLWPEDLKARATVDSWMDWQQTTLHLKMTPAFYWLMRTPDEKRDAHAAATAVAKSGRLWGIVEGQLARHPYICGPELTLADFALGVYVHRWFGLPIERPPHPHLEAWHARLLQRPAYATHVGGPVQ